VPPHAADLVAHLSEAVRRQPEVLLAAVFGSVARGEARPGSDVDLAILLAATSLARRHEIEADLGRAAGCEVDLIDLADAPPQLRFEIARDGQLLYEQLPYTRAILERPRDEYLAERPQRDLVSFYLQLAIQEAIDLAAYWVSDEGWTPPSDASSTFDVLAEHGAIDRALATAMRAAVGMRNRIAHGYAGLDHQRLHAEASTGVRDVERFLAAIAAAAGI
jgi:uncharacterized protein